MARRSSRSSIVTPEVKKHSWPRPWTRTENSKRLVIHWRVFTVFAGGALVVGWLVVSLALYQFIKQSAGYTDVRYAHVVGLPWTLKAYRQAKGEFWVRTGLAEAEAGDWRQALTHLRMGLPYVPENEAARLMVARIYLMAGRPDLAQPVLVEGLTYSSDKSEYLRSVVGFLFARQADAAVVEVANGLLTTPTLSGGIRRMVALARVYGYFNRDQFEQAMAALRSEGLEQSVEGRFVEARIAWETGSPETALIMLRELHNRAPKDAEVYRTLVFYLREMGRLDDARRIALAWQWAQPDSPDAYVDYISLCKQQGNEASLEKAEKDFIKQFSDKSDALVRLITWAAKEGAPDLAWRLAALVPPLSDGAGVAWLLAVEAELNSGMYKSTREKIAEALASKQAWTSRQKQMWAALDGVAQLGMGMKAEARQVFSQVAAGAGISATSLTSLAVHVRKIGDNESAGLLLRRAIELDPLHQPSLVELLRLELKNRSLDDDIPLVERLPGMRKPPGELMYEIVANLESDRYLFVGARRSAITALNARLATVRYQPGS